MVEYVPRYRGFGGAAEGHSGAGQVAKCAVFGNDVWENVGIGGIRWVVGMGESLGRSRSARLLHSEGAPKEPTYR